jgi:hypothetical protein
MEKLFLVVVLAGLGFGVWSLFLKKKKSAAPSTTSGGTWGGGGTSDKGDGSVTPPSNGSNQV